MKLLDRILDPGAEPTYALMQDAMAHVIPEQRWGISVLADDGSTVRTKVGWVEDPDGWIVNSSGRVLLDGSPVVISVMSDRNASWSPASRPSRTWPRLTGDVVRARRESITQGDRDLLRLGAALSCVPTVPPISAC